VVNIPSFRLWAYAAGAEQPLLDMRVIVGSSANPTPLFVGQLRRLEFNPYWNVPYNIAREEIIPALERDPAYLKKNNMELVPKSAPGEPQRTLDGAALEGLKAGHYRVRQRPGPGNAMGSVKFVMPNPDSIYLHSTAAPSLFKRVRRDLSHGCIRVERPFELAQFVLAGQPEWSVARIEQAMAPGASQTASLDVPVPVQLLYATALSDADGEAIFAHDIYQRDSALHLALKARRTAEGVRSDIRTRSHR
jgi:murein L,D-transpeptidase YcbB/YkuD